jgi:hypothetical protein
MVLAIVGPLIGESGGTETLILNSNQGLADSNSNSNTQTSKPVILNNSPGISDGNTDRHADADHQQARDRQ